MHGVPNARPQVPVEILRRWKWQQPGFLGGEQLSRAAPRPPVDPLPGPPGAPRLGAVLRIGQAGEVLAGEKGCRGACSLSTSRAQ